ncbi:MAG: guanylate kinase [Mariprofundus sp.]|nr:guanylate kinase [Mariprofundus sp.]
MNGRLFIISGPSGAGKSSLCTQLLAQRSDLSLSVSCTTRDPRNGECDGQEYHFLSLQQFKKQVREDAFLEWAQVHGNLYGTRQSDVEAIMAKGDNVLLEIDWQGAQQVAEKMPQALRMFILPPSVEVLRQRLISRGQDAAEVVERRVAAAETEMAHADEAHHQVINDDFETALKQLLDIFRPS